MTLGQLVALMRQHWPFAPGNGAVVSGYAALGMQHRHVLTDIALRNGVFGEAPPAADLFQAGIAEGRRRCALEIFQLAHVPPGELYRLIERRPSGQGQSQ